MTTIESAHETIIEQLDAREQTENQLRAEIADWGPIHSAVLNALKEDGQIAPAGEGVVA